MRIEHLETELLLAVESASETLFNNCQVGWFDGGCHTLAFAIYSVFQGTTLYHVSRDKEVPDHSVVKFDDFNLYFDADGFHTTPELFKKMEGQELVTCKVLIPYESFDATELVCIDTVDFLKSKLTSIYNRYISKVRINEITI